LLAYNNIAVTEGPHPRKAYTQARDIQNAHKRAPIPHDGLMYPERPQGRVNPDPVPSNPPPDVKPGERPPLPAPVGPLGPPPTPVPARTQASPNRATTCPSCPRKLTCRRYPSKPAQPMSLRMGVPSERPL